MNSSNHVLLLISKVFQNLIGLSFLKKIFLLLKFIILNFSFPLNKNNKILAEEIDNEFKSEVISYDYNKNEDKIVLLFK